jgi:ribose transport system ATP-binding protein
LDGADFDLNDGEIHGLVGENGSGKSTLAHIIAGVILPESGAMLLEGKNFRSLGPLSAQKMGIGIVCQENPLIDGITVAQNIFIGSEPRNRLGIISERKMNECAGILLEGLGMSEIDPRDVVGALTEGQRKFVGYARAARIGARLVIIDEPTAGLSPEEEETAYLLIRGLKSRGTSVILISNDPSEILPLCDRMTIFANGRRFAAFEARKTALDDIVKAAGGTPGAPYPDHGAERAPAVVERLGPAPVVRAGETVGIRCGAPEKLRMIRSMFGADPTYRPEMRAFGIKMRANPPGNAVRHRIGLSPDERKLRNNALMITARKKVAYARVEHSPQTADGNEGLQILGMGHRFDPVLETEALIQDINGGNAAPSDRARWLFEETDLVIFDEPSRGADLPARREIYKLIDKLAGRGKRIALFSQNQRELDAVCGRVLQK